MKAGAAGLHAAVVGWRAIVATLADAYPTTRYAGLDDAARLRTAMAWHQAMRDVPAYAIVPLYERTMLQWTSKFPPGLGDFRAAWDEWEAPYADLNGENDEPVAGMDLPALMGGSTDEAHVTPALRAARIQQRRVADGLGMICCACLNECGLPTPATLTEGDVWVCPNRSLTHDKGCDFLLALADSAAYRPQPPPECGSDNTAATNAAATQATVPVAYFDANAPRLAWTDLQLVALLREHGMLVGEVGDETAPDGAASFTTAIRFARRMESTLPPLYWCRDILRAMWITWGYGQREAGGAGD